MPIFKIRLLGDFLPCDSYEFLLCFGYSCLVRYMVCKYFLPFPWLCWLFILLTVSSAVKKCFSLIKSCLFIFAFVARALDVNTKTQCQNQHQGAFPLRFHLGVVSAEQHVGRRWWGSRLFACPSGPNCPKDKTVWGPLFFWSRDMIIPICPHKSLWSFWTPESKSRVVTEWPKQRLIFIPFKNDPWWDQNESNWCWGLDKGLTRREWMVTGSPIYSQSGSGIGFPPGSSCNRLSTKRKPNLLKAADSKTK